MLEPRDHFVILAYLTTSTSIALSRLRSLTLNTLLLVHDNPNLQDFPESHYHHVDSAFYNWFLADKRLDQWLQRSARKIKSNVDARKNIVRSNVRQGDGLMTGVLERPDQQGNFNLYVNFKSSIDEDQKYTLNRNADEVADCFIEVLKSS